MIPVRSVSVTHSSNVETIECIYRVNQNGRPERQNGQINYPDMK